MSKVKIVVTHEEVAEVDIGSLPVPMFAELIKRQINDDYANWSVSDLGADWNAIKLEVDGKDYEL